MSTDDQLAALTTTASRETLPSNSELTHAHAGLVAQALTARGRSDPAALVQVAFEQLLCRPPAAEELELCVKFLTTSPSPASDAGYRRSYERLVHSLMNHYEFRMMR